MQAPEMLAARSCSECLRPALPYASRCAWCDEAERERERIERAEERAHEQRCACADDDRCAPCEAVHAEMEAAGETWTKGE